MCSIVHSQWLKKLMNGKKHHSYPTSLDIIAKRLNVRLIIVQARQALVGPYSEAVVVCLSITGFTIEIYEFMHSLRTFWHVPLRMPLRDGDRGQGLRRIEDDARTSESRCMEDG